MSKRGFQPRYKTSNTYSNPKSYNRNSNEFWSDNHRTYASFNYRSNYNENLMHDRRERHFSTAIPNLAKSNSNSCQQSQKEIIKISIDNQKCKLNNNSTISKRISIQNPCNINTYTANNNEKQSEHYSSIPTKASDKEFYTDYPTKASDKEFYTDYSTKKFSSENHGNENLHTSFTPKRRKIDSSEITPKTIGNNMNLISNNKNNIQELIQNGEIQSTSCIPDETGTNPHLKSLEHYDKDLAQVKSQITLKLKLVKEARDKFVTEFNDLQELKVIKKTLVEKVKKVCKEFTKENQDESDVSDKEEQITEPKEIIDLKSSSESEDSDSSDTLSSEVEIISETPKKVITDTSVSKTPPTSEKSANSSQNILFKPSSPKSKSSPIIRKPIKISLNDSLDDKIKESKVFNLSTDSDKNILNLTDVKPIRGKGSMSDSCTSLPALNVPPGFDMTLRADAANGLFNAIEPRLDTIVVSDKHDCCITDVKVFNNRLFVSASHGLLRQYDLINHNIVMEYLGHKELVHCILPTAQPVGFKRLLSGGFDQHLLIHDIDTGHIMKQISCDRPIMTMCDLHDLVYYGTGGGSIGVYSLVKDREMNTLHASTSGISCLCATKEGNKNLLFAGFNDGEYCIYDAINFNKIKVITPMAFVEHPIGFVLLQKQRILAFTKHHVHFIHYMKSKYTTTFNHLPVISSMCLTKNYVIAGEKSGNISIYKLKGSLILKNPIQKIQNENYSIPSLTFYNNTIITGNMNGKICFNRLVES